MRALIVALAGAALVVTVATSCKKKASREQCDELLDRYATLVTNERLPDASPAAVKEAKDTERRDARGDESFKRCPTEVTEEIYACAMKAQTSEALLRCLE